MTRRRDATLEIKRSVEIRHPCNGRWFGPVAYILLATPAYIMSIKRAATATGFSGCDWPHGRWRAVKHLAARPIFIACRWTIGLPGISWRRIRRSLVLFDSCARVGVLLIASSAASRGWFHVSSPSSSSQMKQSRCACLPQTLKQWWRDWRPRPDKNGHQLPDVP